MELQALLEIYKVRVDELVSEYLSRVSRISGKLTAQSISDRFWDFNVLMQDLEQTLNIEACRILDLYAMNDGQKTDLQKRMQEIAREACRRFNILGKPGSGSPNQ